MMVSVAAVPFAIATEPECHRWLIVLLEIAPVTPYIKQAKLLPTTFCILTASVVHMTTLGRATTFCG